MTDTTQMFFDSFENIPMLKIFQNKLVEEVLRQKSIEIIASTRDSDIGKKIQQAVDSVERIIGVDSAVFVKLDESLCEFYSELCSCAFVRGIYLSCRLLDDHFYFMTINLSQAGVINSL